MMRDNQLLSVQEWPIKCGGGNEMAQEMIIQILKIFNIPFNQQVYEREVDEISAGLAKADIIYLTLNSLKYLNSESIPIGITLISRLVFSAESSKQFAQQFVQANGLGIITKYELLGHQNNPIVIVDTLSLIS